MKSTHISTAILLLMTSYAGCFATAELSQSSPMDPQSAINDAYVFQADDSSQDSNDFAYDKGYISDSGLHQPEEGSSHFIAGKEPLQDGAASGYGVDSASSANYPQREAMSTKDPWKAGVKRFNEFLGKRNLLSSFPKEKISWSKFAPGFSKLSPSDEEILMKVVSNMKGDPKAAWSKLFNTSDKRRKEMLMRLYRSVFRKITAKDTPKRQYEFVGKRFKDDSEPEFGGQVLVAGDGQTKRYEFLGKKSYDFLGKRNYDFLGKRSYDFLGKRNYDFLGKKSYDFLGKRNYDFLGKRSYDFLGKRDYDFLGKRPFADEKRSYDFLGKRKQDLPVTENIDNDRASTGGMATHRYLGTKMFLPPNMHHTPRRYSEWLGKRKRSSMPISTHQRLALLLRDNTLRKRLSRMLMSSRVGKDRAPEFIGK